ncbi:SUMF1/EgtB/PvdO family nonheme iron enzyme [Fibrobacter sp.]|uniref:SUMF1/EgtB/PvdO family nonheme iron enzyme n=1 Tax=Fibrobacter sp. TaxID=35828 RepID=UPI00389114E9
MKSAYSRFLFLGASTLFALLAGCTNSSSSSTPGEDNPPKDETSKETLEGFALFDNDNKSVALGTNEKAARTDEKPQMKVELDYDFYIGKHEVTCGEFKEVIDADFAKDCKGDNFPITNVTFFDAVLFANAKSKAESNEGDTAYTYTAAEFDSEGHCILLENYDFDPSAKAFRLPTEAEWAFTAEQFFDTENSWNADNSDFELHEVCTADNSQKVCDMAGNALEWVNDWFTNFKDSTLVNFAGARESDGLGKRIVKGGSYRIEPKSIKAYSRGDIYTVTSSTYADYVGFRLAFGVIPNVTFFGEPRDTTEADTIKSSTSALLDLDSAGMYYKSGGSENALYLRNNMEILWNHRDSKLAVVGSSRSMAGVIPKKFDESLDAINLSNIPNSIFVSEYLFKNYLAKHLKHLKYVVVALDIDMWWRNKEDSYDNFFYTEYKQYPGFVYDENHDFWDGVYPEGLAEATHTAFNLDFFKSTYIEARGFKGEQTGAWDNENAVVGDSTWKEKTPKLYEENLESLKSIVKTANENDIAVIGVIFPMSPVYKTTGSYGRYGLRRSEAPGLIQEIAALSKTYPNFVLMDENKMGDHDYTNDMAYNTDHLSEKGAEHFTARLDSLIKTLD